MNRRFAFPALAITTGISWLLVLARSSGADEPIELSPLLVTAQPYDSARGTLETGALAFAGRAAIYQSGGWRPHSRQDRESVFAAARFPLDRDSELTIRFFGSQPWHERFSWSSSIYHAIWRDEFLRLADENGSPRGTVNAGRTVHSGWESTIEWDVLTDATADVSLWATYNLCDARLDGDPLYGDRKTIASTAGVLDRAPDPENTAIFLPAAGRSVDLCFEYAW